MQVSRNAYYNWLKVKDKRNEVLVHLKDRIAFLFKDNREIYGCARIQKMLERERRLKILGVLYRKTDGKDGFKKCFKKKVYCYYRFKS